MHVVFIMANNSSVPYFSWFAEESLKYPGLKFSFIAMHRERPAMLDQMKSIGCDCYWVPYDDSKRKRGMLSAVIKLLSLFRKLKPSVVHTHLFDDSLPGLVAARMAGVKVRVVTKQDTGFHWFFKPQFVRFDRMNNNNATHLLAVSGECRDFLIEKERADKRKIVLVHHGIPVDRSTRQDDITKQRLIERFALKDKIVIGTVARLIEWKGYRYIIDAAETIVKKYPHARFLWAGEGAQKPELEKLIREKGLTEHIIFTGWVDRKDIPSLYGIMDIYLHAASYEPFGFVIAEAMLNGVPVVSTNTGAARDAIRHKENGYLVPYSDAAALAEGVAYMMENDRKKIGEAGMTTAMELFTFERMWQGHIDLYRNALNQRI